MADKMIFLPLTEVASQTVTLHRGARVQGVSGLNLIAIVDEDSLADDPEILEVVRFPNDTDVVLVGPPDVEADFKYIGSDLNASWYIQHDELTR